MNVEPSKKNEGFNKLINNELSAIWCFFFCPNCNQFKPRGVMELGFG